MSTIQVDDAAIAALLDPLTVAVAKASAAILAVKASEMGVSEKSDGSPVTQADLAADRVIASEIARLAPHIPVISEERFDPAAKATGTTLFLVDPIDGTREYVHGTGEYAVNLALVRDGAPVLGIIAAPARGLIWRGIVGMGAKRMTFDPARPEVLGAGAPIRTRRPPPGECVAAVSRSHMDDRTRAFLASRKGVREIASGSAIKFGLVAEGNADVYPRLGPTSEWDIAAGHALVAAAGGKVTGGDGRPLRYGRHERNYRVDDFIAWGDASAAL